MKRIKDTPPQSAFRPGFKGSTSIPLVLKNWKRATGIRASRYETNSGLADRDYSVRCNVTWNSGAPIAFFEGYYLWWCEAHHQPLACCDKGKLQDTIDRLVLKLKRVKEAVE